MQSPAGGGKLRIWLGIAPGVGKSYAMLREARARQRSGTDTVVAHWERHGRSATAAQLADLEVLPARMVTYQGASFAEPDVLAVLDRRPELAVVDELAHANLPGERHARRWQDVGELLANRIDVYTTLNVANIESLGETVSRITGVHAAEPVPDAFARAGEITLVDLAPAALRHRLAQGLVFPKDRVDAALSSYFRFANLAALRELAQLWLDDSVPDPAAAFAAARGISGPVNASVIVVGLEGSPADEWLIRYTAHLAGLSDARLHGVHVTAIDNLDRAPAARLEQDRGLLGELGGTLRVVRAGDLGHCHSAGRLAVTHSNPSVPGRERAAATAALARQVVRSGTSGKLRPGPAEHPSAARATSGGSVRARSAPDTPRNNGHSRLLTVLQMLASVGAAR
jgi:two-component system sensor histidine kinase KdpD